MRYKANPDQSLLTLALRPGFKVVRFEYVLTDKSICLWIEQSLRPDIKEAPVTFKVVRTSEPVQDSMEYISTAVDPMGDGEWHLYSQGSQQRESQNVRQIAAVAA
ncbi:hypothetical protein QKW35_11025 [Pontibacterium granulatum]|uniref:DUF7352 domain-containing protein n=1 Tax=Pontibacterium granulatum TaxID=2036029 RepID=UPI00249B41F3|nr:hypothetical protein [Pontibacterium granulatum]MDI3324911.1 hypothetical protein [Pontibacterium granulatum]